MTPPAGPPVLSRTLDLAHLPETALRQPITVTADAAQREALAAEFGIVSIASLTGCFRLRRDHGVVQAQLDLDARVTQSCIVTLDPVEQLVAERAPLTFLTEAQATDRNLDNQPIDPDAPDDIVAEGTIVDLGAILTEQLALALDPYPRTPEATLASTPAPRPPNPFAHLRAGSEEP